MESTTGYTFTPCVGSFTSPGIDTRLSADRRDQRLLVSHPEDTEIHNVESQGFTPNNARRLVRESNPGWPRDKRAC